MMDMDRWMQKVKIGPTAVDATSSTNIPNTKTSTDTNTTPHAHIPTNPPQNPKPNPNRHAPPPSPSLSGAPRAAPRSPCGASARRCGGAGRGRPPCAAAGSAPAPPAAPASRSSLYGGGVVRLWVVCKYWSVARALGIGWCEPPTAQNQSIRQTTHALRTHPCW